MKTWRAQRILFLFVASLALTSRLFGYGDLDSDQRLKRLVNLDGNDQSIETVLKTLTNAAKVPLTVDPDLKELHLSVKIEKKPCWKVMEVIAATLRLKWEKKDKGWMLTRSQEEKEKTSRLFQVYIASQAEAERRLARADAKSKEIRLFAESLIVLKSSMSDDEVLEHAKGFPAAYEFLKENPEAVMVARVMTWLDDSQLSKLAEGKVVHLTRQEVLRTGSDLGLGFTLLTIQIQDDEVLNGTLLWQDTPNAVKLRPIAFR